MSAAAGTDLPSQVAVLPDATARSTPAEDFIWIEKSMQLFVVLTGLPCETKRLKDAGNSLQNASRVALKLRLTSS